jgi:putative ABC transport system substrate-binding protein
MLPMSDEAKLRHALFAHIEQKTDEVWKSIDDLQKAMEARTLGLQIHVLHASNDRDFDTVFATLAQLRAGGLVISSDSLFFSRSEQLAVLAAHHAVPAIYHFREHVSAGDPISQRREIG